MMITATAFLDTRLQMERNTSLVRPLTMIQPRRRWLRALGVTKLKNFVYLVARHHNDRIPTLREHGIRGEM